MRTNELLQTKLLTQKMYIKKKKLCHSSKKYFNSNYSNDSDRVGMSRRAPVYEAFQVEPNMLMDLENTSL